MKNEEKKGKERSTVYKIDPAQSTEEFTVIKNGNASAFSVMKGTDARL